MRRFVGKIWRAMPRLLRRIVKRGTQTNFTVSASAVVFDRAGQRVLLLDHVLRDGFGEENECEHRSISGAYRLFSPPAKKVTSKYKKLLAGFTDGRLQHERDSRIVRSKTADFQTLRTHYENGKTLRFDLDYIGGGSTFRLHDRFFKPDKIDAFQFSWFDAVIYGNFRAASVFDETALRIETTETSD